MPLVTLIGADIYASVLPIELRAHILSLAQPGSKHDADKEYEPKQAYSKYIKKVGSQIVSGKNNIKPSDITFNGFY